ncbi:hypothetical protein GSI_04712 [Ganoderma sinense ZZ0214-1]|uniref:Uncharacterized protein n=1 Tax=Ganoderma sinense ZZ0214-1 TaxID=1077348 RepID=A0A2G8SHM6_9APHY|nr:hypothetical protein GSI_04712 [Ganoderma sinense ZZ0214-1]
MSYEEHEITLSWPPGAVPEENEEVLVTALHWSGRNGGGSPALLIVGYMHHGIRGSASVSPDSKYIAVSDVFTGFHVYHLDNGKSFKHFEQEVSEERPVPVIWVHGGNAILGSSTIPKIMVWYVHTGSKRITLPIPGNSKVLAVTAYDDSNSDGQVFFIAGGTETKDHEFSVVIWRAEERKGPEFIADSDDESSSGPEPELTGAPGHHFAAWLLLGGLMVAGIAVGHKLAGSDIFS